MSVDEEFAQISASLDKLQSELVASLPRANNPELRQKIESACEQLRQGRSRFAAEYHKAMAVADARLAGAQKKAQEVLAQVEAAQKKLAAPPLPQVPPRPKKPPFVVDLTLGQKLRQELLDRYAPHHREAEETAWAASREVWDDWDQQPNN